MPLELRNRCDHAASVSTTLAVQPKGNWIALLLDSPLIQPALEFHVVRHHLSQHDIQRIFRADSDEPGIVFEQFAGVLFETDFSFQDDWLFQNRLALAFSFFSSSSLLFSPLVATGPKHAALFSAPMGGSDPTGHFRDRRAEKWGRSRPTPCFGPVAFLCRLLRISLVFLGFARLLGDAQTERPPERHPLHPVHPDSSSLARKSGCFGTR